MEKERPRHKCWRRKTREEGESGERQEGRGFFVPGTERRDKRKPSNSPFYVRENDGYVKRDQGEEKERKKKPNGEALLNLFS